MRPANIELSHVSSVKCIPYRWYVMRLLPRTHATTHSTTMQPLAQKYRFIPRETIGHVLLVNNDNNSPVPYCVIKVGHELAVGWRGNVNSLRNKGLSLAVMQRVVRSRSQ